MTDILYRLKNPPFGVETTERHMFSAAAARIEALERENARLRHVSDNVIIAYDMGWDMDGVIEAAKEALA